MLCSHLNIALIQSSIAEDLAIIWSQTSKMKCIKQKCGFWLIIDSFN